MTVEEMREEVDFAGPCNASSQLRDVFVVFHFCGKVSKVSQCTLVPLKWSGPPRQ